MREIQINKFLLALFLILGACSPEEKKEPTAVEIKEVPSDILATGSLVAHSIVQVRPQVQGVLKEAYVKEGDDVREGDLLYQIDPGTYEADLEAAIGNLEQRKAALDMAKSVVKRNKPLVEKKYITKATFEQFETTAKTAEAKVVISLAEVKRAKINVDSCKIRAPIDGKITLFNVYAGTVLSPTDQQSVIEISVIDPIDLVFSIPQVEFQKIQEVQSRWPLPIEITLPQEAGKKVTSTIDFTDEHIDEHSKTVQFKTPIDNREGNLLPGQIVNIRIILKP